MYEKHASGWLGGSAQRLALLGVLGSFLVSWPTVLAADEVVLRGESGRRTRVVGTVLDYTGNGLILQHPSGREESFPAERVLEIETTWGEDCQAADAAFAEHDFAAALPLYRAAFAAERRGWARRRIAAQLIWCLHATGQFTTALDAFQWLYENDTATPYLACIPLCWSAEVVDESFRAKCIEALRATSPASRLIAASWLLSTAQRSEAARVLNGWRDKDVRLAYLAAAQSWRSQVGRASAAEVGQWQERIAAMPAEIRAGPWYTVARGWSHHRQHEAAALAYLRVPVLYLRQRDLAARGLVAAGRELEQLSQPEEALVLYREVVTDYPASPATATARERLTALTSAATEAR